MRPRMLVLSPHPDEQSSRGWRHDDPAHPGWRGVTVLTFAAHKPPLFPEEVTRRSIEEVEVAFRRMGVDESIFMDYAALSLERIPAGAT